MEEGYVTIVHFFFVFKANLWPVESWSVFLFPFFFQFCDVVQSAHHPIHKYTLAKFEDIQNMKVENLKPSHIVAIIVVIFLGASNLLNFGNFLLLKKEDL